LVGARINWSKLLISGAYSIEEANCLSTRGLFLRARDLIDLGGFRARLLPHYLSDYEFSIRARRNGYMFLSDPRVRLWHDQPLSLPAAASSTSLRLLLSKRSHDNPIYWTAFLVLSCPPKNLPLSIVRIWWRFVRSAGRGIVDRRAAA
jgi:GT2 family glycosyltransferase